MEPMGKMLVQQNAFQEIVMGNTALVRAMVESGTRVVTSYPGSPTPEIATAIQSIPADQRPFYFEFSINEKVACEVAYGAAINGHLSTVFFKSVGMNVAADTFVQLNLMNIIGGMVIVLGDDPGANSSQNEQDNRHFARMGYTPVLEPGSPREVYTFYRAAAALSAKYRMPVILRLTTHVCHAREKVAFGPYPPRTVDDTPRFDVENGPYIPLAASVAPLKKRALENLAAVEKAAEESPLNRLIDNNNRRIGIITMGLPFLSLMDVLETQDAKPDILKLGFVHPIPRELVRSFVARHREVLVIEELDDILENDVKRIAFEAGVDTKIYGKETFDDWIGEYTADRVFDILKRRWPKMLPDTGAQGQEAADFPGITVPDRPAQLCPGCGHRSAFHAIKKAVGPTDITVADIGCHTLGFLPPYEMGQLLMCMGASPGIGAGLALFNPSRRVVAFMGDSTFFHAGMPGIANGVFNNHNITLILMENGTTAMTGHQDNPATGRTVNGVSGKISIKAVLESLGVRHVYEVDTYLQDQLTDLVKQAMADDGFSVVIARHPCMLKFTREQRRNKNRGRPGVTIDTSTCKRHYTCVAEFGCPSFTRNSDQSIGVNPDLCIGDRSCVQTCPVSAIVPRKSGPDPEPSPLKEGKNNG